MAYQITNVSGALHTSASLTLAAGASVILNVLRLPIDLAVALANGVLRAEDIDEPPLFNYDWCGFTNRSAGLGSVTQYLPLLGQGATPVTTADQYVYSNGKKLVYNLMGVLATPPGTGNGRVITLLKNGVDTGLSLSFSDLISGAKRSTVLVTLEDLDQIQLKCTVTGTPTTSQFGWALVLANASQYA